MIFYDIISIVGDNMNKKGFVSMAVVYMFLIVFLVLMASFITTYINKNKFDNKIASDIKTMLNTDYYQNVIIKEN